MVAAMVAGATRIDHVGVLRAGRTGRVLGFRPMAPSTVGTFLRTFTFGHVRQLEAVLSRTLARAWGLGAGPGGKPLVVDLMPKTVANATVARLRHHAHVVMTADDSIRLTQATAGKGVTPLTN